MRALEFMTEDDNVTKANFGAKGGPKPQQQFAKPVSMRQAFGSEGYNILYDAGIKLKEKPGYWSDLERDPIGEIGLAKVKKLFKQAGVPLREVDAWEVYPIMPEGYLDDLSPEERKEFSQHDLMVRGPQASVEDVPFKGVFVIRDLPYYSDAQDKMVYGDFLVDSQGASKYIRYWRKI